MHLSIVCDILSVMGPYSSTLKIAEIRCNPPLHGYSPPPTLHLYISAYNVDKNNLKWREIQLPVDCRVGSLIAIN